MSFLNTPIISLQATSTAVVGVSTLPWNNPNNYPLAPGAPTPAPINLPYRWSVTLNIATQSQSSWITRAPGYYTGQDVSVGQWITDTNTGRAWQIYSVTAKTDTQATVLVQDIYRYVTFRDPGRTGNATPPTGGNFIIFALSDNGLPLIDPSVLGLDSIFFTNLSSRFEYVNLQNDFALYVAGNSFTDGDVIACDTVNHTFTLADASHKTVIGRITSVSGVIPGWITLNPVQKIVDYMDSLPGNVADTIYSSTTTPGAITTTPGGAELYIKLRDYTSSVSVSTAIGPTTPNNVFQLNGTDITVTGSGTAADLITETNLASSTTGVTASIISAPTTDITNLGLISPTYGEPVLSITGTIATATINGVLVSFNIASTDSGYTGFTRGSDMVTAINNAAIPNIVATADLAENITITNTTGAAITIVNVTPDSNGVYFAGPNSGSGLALSVPASTTNLLKFVAIDARAISFIDVVGTPTIDFGLVSVENGVKAAGLYIEQGLRQASTTVVANLTALNSLSALIGDQAYVINSDDGNGNNVGEWSMWLWDGSVWVQTSNQRSATTDAKSLEATLAYNSASSITVGTIGTGTRVTLITVDVSTAFSSSASLTIGYTVTNPSSPVTVPAGLMLAAEIDLSKVDTYSTVTDILFGTDTPQGDVTITATYTGAGSTSGLAKIVVSYV